MHEPPAFTPEETVAVCQILTHPDIIGLTNESLCSATMVKVYGALAHAEGTMDFLSPEEAKAEAIRTENTIDGAPAEVAKELREKTTAVEEDAPPAAEKDVPPDEPEEAPAETKGLGRHKRLAMAVGDGCGSNQILLAEAMGFTFTETPLTCSNAAFNRGSRKTFTNPNKRQLRRWMQARQLMQMVPAPDKQLLKAQHRNVLNTLLGYLGKGGAHTNSWSKDEAVDVCRETLLEIEREDRLKRLAEASKGPKHRDHERAMEAGYTTKG